VLLPVLMTMALAWPSRAFVEKNAIFFVSMGLWSVHSGDRFWGSASPVRQLLSTLKAMHSSIRTSAGIQSPVKNGDGVMSINLKEVYYRIWSQRCLPLQDLPLEFGVSSHHVLPYWNVEPCSWKIAWSDPIWIVGKTRRRQRQRWQSRWKLPKITKRMNRLFRLYTNNL
jgi:hypothetical protein